MGCDIHMYREKLVNGKWVSADEFVKEYEDEPADVPWDKRFTDRNYDLFGFLCDGVRTSFEFSFKARGLPLAMSYEVMSIDNSWRSDGHSHSHLYLHELKEASELLSELKVTVSGMNERESLSKFLLELKSENPNYDKLYPYCKWSSMDCHEEFSVEVPASYMIGNDINRIISMFDNDDGDNHRIVFWFDN